MNDGGRGRPSLGGAALAVSVLALVVALTGVAVGLPGKNKIDKNDLKANVVKSKHVAPDALVGEDIAPDAIRGEDIAPDAVRGEDIAESSLAEVPVAGAPFAYARVLDPTGPAVGVDEARSRGITDAMLADSSGIEGKTCFDLPFAIRGAQVTIDYAQAGSENLELTSQVAVGDPYSNCSPPFTDAVVSVHGDTTTTLDRGFYIAFYR